MYSDIDVWVHCCCFTSSIMLVYNFRVWCVAYEYLNIKYMYLMVIISY